MRAAVYTGDLIRLTAGAWSAVIAPVGAAVQSLQLNGRDVIDPAPLTAVNTAYQGVLLAPWPCRLDGGRYEAHGQALAAPVTEAATGTALHGLTPFAEFTVRSTTASSAVLTHTIAPSPGYPFRVRITAEFTLTEQGLDTVVTADNLGHADAPYGMGPHPYLVAGSGPIDEWRLEVPADQVLLMDERMLPRALRNAQDEPDYDFRPERSAPLGPRAIDNTYTSLTAGRVTLFSADGSQGAAVEFDPTALPWVQIYTRRDGRGSVAVEPLTCPPNAFASGTDLLWIEPDTSVQRSWRITGW